MNIEHRIGAFEALEVRASGAGADYVTQKGEAVVYKSLSHDLGGFREQIMPGAFDHLLRDGVPVFHVAEHDMARVLSATQNGSLDLRSTPHGLHVWSRINARTSYGKDEIIKLEDGLVRGMSFAFSVDPDGEDWTTEDGTVLRTITKASGLYDVSNVAMGAYPAAHAELVRSHRRAVEDGRAPEGVGLIDVAGESLGTQVVAPSEGTESTTEQVSRAAVLRARLRVAQSKSL